MSQPKTTKKDPASKQPAPVEQASTPALVPTVSRETLEDTPARVLTFLRAVGTSSMIRMHLGRVGYEEADHHEGWQLLHAVSGFQEDKAPPVDGYAPVREAISALDALDEDLFRMVRGSLTRRFPDQATFVLQGIGPSEGPAAVLGVKTLLQRLEVLEKGTERPTTKTQDAAALAALAKAGVNASERKRLAALVTTAESLSAAPADDVLAKEKREAALVQALVALRAWFEQWSTLARVAVKRRDQLIRLGLASRRQGKKGDAPEEDAEEPTGAPEQAPQ